MDMNICFNLVCAKAVMDMNICFNLVCQGVHEYEHNVSMSPWLSLNMK